MRLGFVGTGVISAAVIRGLRGAGWNEPIVVSPRNAGLASQLASEWENVVIAASNQAVLDRCDTVVLGVRPQIAEDVLESLAFHHDHVVISLIATFSTQRLERLIGKGPSLCRAIPLPFVEERAGSTPVYPATSAAYDIFARLGGALGLDNENELDVLMAASATMGAFFQQQATIADWLVTQGVSPAAARAYLGQLVRGLSLSAEKRPAQDFAELAVEFSTPGGLNEQLRKILEDAGTQSALRSGLDAVLARVIRG